MGKSMPAIFEFTCSRCGKVHEGSPSFGFRAPDQYSSLSDAQKVELGSLSEDFCTITNESGTDRFVRAVLEVPIHGVEQPFIWGVWVSLSEKSYARYRETFGAPVEGEAFFGWVCNTLTPYPCAQPRGADVVVQGGRRRPKVVLHRGDPEDDRLVLDQMHGISASRAQAIAERVMHGD